MPTALATHAHKQKEYPEDLNKEMGKAVGAKLHEEGDKNSLSCSGPKTGLSEMTNQSCALAGTSSVWRSRGLWSQ